MYWGMVSGCGLNWWIVFHDKNVLSDYGPSGLGESGLSEAQFTCVAGSLSQSRPIARGFSLGR